MARTKQDVADTATQSTQAQEPRFLLKKNAGVMVGRKSMFFPAGTEFDGERDREMIAFLIRSGSQFE